MTDHHLDLEGLARLARLTLNDSEHATLAGELDDILTFVDELARIDTTGVAPMAHAFAGGVRTRPDVVTETDRRDRFLSLAPAAEEGHFLVPKVVE